ncbi:hypothetical protein [Alteromonas sp. 14N.309.X.WAT.G.H12]|uniref:hypothetical protein n=1 Tax=Alteromonas sp. 14N.309.X.WAT.G.H12 TaxID=3120824 RepID=UPI002FD0439F
MNILRVIKKESLLVESAIRNIGTPNPKILTGQQIQDLVPDEILALADKIKLLVRDKVDKDLLHEHIKSSTANPVTKVAFDIAFGRRDPNPSPQSPGMELTAAQKSLFPYIVSQSPKVKGSLIGFSAEDEVKPMWFFATGGGDSGTVCMGYDGLPRKLEISKIAMAGYQQISKPQSELKQACRKSLPEGITTTDIREVNYFVSRYTLQTAMYEVSKQVLRKLVTSLPEIVKKNQLDNKEIPKI